MSLIDDLKGNAVSGILIGIGAAVVAPVVLPILASIAKPVAKAAVKGGIMMYEKGKEVVAETGEMIEDIVAEAKAELAEEQQAAAAGAAVGAAGESMQDMKDTFAPGEGQT
jgi:galactitol-specific phosphotransferase system IIC component